uniref:NADH-ubiquinone oxidoreductase chain 3 n=1 Tax=Carybdea xaymacana TaxID=168719 RepID=G9IT67_9CNID|nr:NADH dehydrogenase subunit 3 [Carybdea xaymacana]
MESFILLIFLVVSFLLSLIIAFAAWFLSDKAPDREKLSPYECGFDPFGQPGHPISIKFFLIAILFLIFDLEITLLIPWGYSFGGSSWFNFKLALIFIFLLVWGLVYEWLAGGLEWE